MLGDLIQIVQHFFMVYVLLLTGFDLVFVAQLAARCKLEGVEMRTIGLTGRAVSADSTLTLTSALVANGQDLSAATLVIPNCAATNLLLTEPRIHRLVRGCVVAYAAQQSAATLARIGLTQVKTVQTVQEISMVGVGDSDTIINEP